jgi:probable DNA metabolism protein
MRYDLDELFARLDAEEVSPLSPPPLREDGQGDLFGGDTAVPLPPLPGPLLTGGEASPVAAELVRLSAEAYGVLLHGWMSELPIGGELVRFGRKILSAGRKAAASRRESPFAVQLAERRAVERVLGDRGDPDVAAVLEAASKVRQEIHRLLGFLRFSSGPQGQYAARCAPDHFVLPALAAPFRRRFKELSWAIHDEKRGLRLVRLPGEEPELHATGGDFPACGEEGADPWEELWRRYHRVVSIENRRNPGLQRQFIPLRYWDYLPEMTGPARGDSSQRARRG